MTDLVVDQDAEILGAEPWPGYVPIGVKYHGQNPARIFEACPHATDVRGFRDWLKAGRVVQKGQKGIPIQVPVWRDAYEDDPEHVKELRSVKLAYVFDISQTAPMPPREEATEDMETTD
jgi:hypothetical protein